eukprot:TRINITY_DN5178_c0_g1_i2.p2 TRINITY_DN5178_c0_g1~~TRINITY_DN5178_c0_g1_i2.p2  ORF type:complete len:104 (+),score=26.81 TRINITY_DN5178_c0_g1_i2:84-395(+)
MLEIHAAMLMPDVEREVMLEKERVKRWRQKKRQAFDVWEDQAVETTKGVMMATLRRTHVVKPEPTTVGRGGPADDDEEHDESQELDEHASNIGGAPDTTVCVT